MKNNARRSSLLITVPITGTALAYLFLFFLPRMESIAEVQRQIDAKQDFINESPKLVTLIREAEDSLAAATTHNRLEEARSVTPTELTKLFGRINQIAKRSGTRTTRFEPQTAVAYQTLSKVPLSLTVEGRSANIHSLIHGVETLGAAVWLEDVRISAAKEDKKSVECNLVMAIFVSNPEKSD